MPEILKNTGADILGSITRSVGAPIALLEGNTRQAGTDAGGAFANSIEASDDLPVIGPYAGPAVAAYFGGPLGYAAAKGVQTGVESSRHGASYGDAALGGAESGAIGGAESYAGSELGSALGDALGSSTGSATGTATDSANTLGGSSSGSMVGQPSAVGSPSIASTGFGGGGLASGTGADSTSGSLLSTGNSADNQFMNGQYGQNGASLATNTGSTAGPNAGQSTGALNSLGNFLQQPTSTVASKALGSSDLANAISNHLAGQTLGSTLGGIEGAQMANKPIDSIYNKLVAPKPVLPGMMPGMALPGDLSNIAGLNPDQQLSNIATQGVYGGGTGTQDDQYFLNQLNNQLVQSPGNYNPMSSISPINSSFLNKLGLGGYSNTQDLLSALQGWQPPQT